MKNKKKWQHAIKNIIFRRKFIVSELYDDLIVINADHYDKIVKSLCYVTPIEIARFTSKRKAMLYIAKHKDEV